MEKHTRTSILGREYISSEEFANIRGVKMRTLIMERYRKRSPVPYLKLNSKRVLYALDDVEAFLAARTHPAGR